MIESTALEFPIEHRRFVSDRSRTGTLLSFHDPVPYSTAWALQSRLHRERLSGLRPDTVAILEHHPVYTVGRSTQPSDWLGNEQVLRANGADIVHVNRGGAITFHGPGQIVLYPILKVADHAAGPRVFVRLLEEVIIRLLAQWGIEGRRIDKKPGVWVMSSHPAKIASIGIRIEQGVSLHGFALNVDPDLTPFRYIHPCGLRDCRMTSMREMGRANLPLADIKHDLAGIFGEVFGIEWTTAAEVPFNHVTADYDPISERYVPHVAG